MLRSVILLTLLGAVIGCASDSTATSERKRRFIQPSYTCAEIVDALRAQGAYINEREVHNPSPSPRNRVSEAENNTGATIENRLKALLQSQELLRQETCECQTFT